MFRVGGPGLGNLLLPWARCIVASNTEGLPMLAPTWPQMKVGPLLRGELDLRSYTSLFRRHPGEVAGARKALALALGTRVNESADLLRRGIPALRLRVFSGMGGMFGDLRGHAQLVRRELLARALTTHIPAGDSSPIGIHVRCGDFRPNANGQAIRPEGVRSGERVPIRYYALALEALRTTVGTVVPATVYSDGTDGELAPLIAMDAVRKAPPKSALFDMLAMSQHRVLLGSPHSTFSMWAAFLGDLEYITFPEVGRDYGMANVILQADTGAWSDQLMASSVARRLLRD